MYLVLPLFSSALLTSSAAVYYTSPIAVGSANGVYTRISNITLTNTDTSPRTVSIYITPAARRANTGNNLTL